MAVPQSEKQVNTNTDLVSVVMVTSETDAGCYSKRHLYKIVSVELVMQNGVKSSVGHLYTANTQNHMTRYSETFKLFYIVRHLRIIKR
jgi:hypothetical protein